MQHDDLARRELLGIVSLTALLSKTGSAADERTGDMIYRKLGRTGERVSAIGMGGYHIGVPKDDQESMRLIRSAIDRGITFMDNCWDYMDGKCEVWMGKALRDGYRQKVFLMTKFDARTKAATVKQIDESLQRLQTDHVDLMQYHENIRMEDPDRFFNERRGGCAARCKKGRQASLHRLYRPQGPRGASAHARGGEGAQFPFRYPRRCRSTSWTRSSVVLPMT